MNNPNPIVPYQTDREWIDVIQSECEVLVRQRDELRELLREAVAPTMAEDWTNEGPQCFYCGEGLIYDSFDEPRKPEKEYHAGGCWLLRVRSALTADDLEPESQPSQP